MSLKMMAPTLPSVGLLILLASFLSHFCAMGTAWKSASKRMATILVVLVLSCAEMLATRSYLAHWRSTASLYEHMLTVTPKAGLVHYNYGNVLRSNGKIEEAIYHYRRALEFNPYHVDAHGSILQSQGKSEEAVSHYLEALKLRPDHWIAHYDLLVGNM